ncbi:MAG: M23 family metallopeptidase [Clostridia bacterium]|nr:M23 family metallopeptidase [Clostridia bacterium]
MKRMLVRAGRFLKRYRAPLCAGILVSALGLTAYRAHTALAGGTFVRTRTIQPVVTQAPEPTRKPAILCFPATGEMLREWTDALPTWSAGLGMYETHAGVDFAGEDVYCARDGVVKSVETDWMYGLVVTVRHDDGCESVYASLGESFVRAGDRAARGARLGRTGTCPREAGSDAHVHFEYHINEENVSPPFAFPTDS